MSDNTTPTDYIHEAKIAAVKGENAAGEKLRYTDGNGPLKYEDFYVVWFSKTLKNWKALVSTNKTKGLYIEVTHNGYDHKTYVDVYIKKHNHEIHTKSYTHGIEGSI